MWISKKKWEALEKRVADLEGKIQGQPNLKVEDIKHVIEKHERDTKRSTFF
jgi:hypothetical protein